MASGVGGRAAWTPSGTASSASACTWRSRPRARAGQSTRYPAWTSCGFLGGRQLLFVSVMIEQSAAGAETLAPQLDAIVERLRGDVAALKTFMARMVAMGWSEEMRNSGELLRLSVRGASVYAVDDDFPRLPDDFAPPPGVVSVKYTVDLANLPELDFDEALALVRQANPGYAS